MRDVVSKHCHFRLLLPWGVAHLSVVTFATPLLKAQEPLATAPAAQTSVPEFKLRVQKNVVIVRVVVRDKKGRAVRGLRKEDFRISDNRKPQAISSFSVETSEAGAVAAQPPAAAPAAKAAPEATATPVAPLSYLAFYFDDLYSVQDSLYRAGQAAEKFIAALPENERVAICTSSWAETLDFTGDRQKIRETLEKLHANTRLNQHAGCPEISDFLANQIVNMEDDNAYKVVADRMVRDCLMPPQMARKAFIRPLARAAYDAYMMQSRALLENLESVIEQTSRMPGERQVMIVSDGFIDLEMLNRVEKVIDQTLRSRVTVSALNGAGLALNMREVDASQSYAPASPTASVLANSYDASAEAAATGTLREIASGTGGQFLTNDNNLLGGMRKMLLPPEVSYVLTFSPTELKADGTFHALKVALANGHDLTIQARKGYFAPKLVSPEEVAKTEIREAIYSSYPLQDLPLTFETEVRKAEGQNVEVAVQAVLDIRNLPFQKQGDLNLDNVVFAVGLFDHDGKYVTGSQQTYSLSLKDSTRVEMEKRGLALKTHVSAKVRAYTLRVVVRDSQGGKMAASSKAVEAPQ
jgi:VWFA-related protein